MEFVDLVPHSGGDLLDLLPVIKTALQQPGWGGWGLSQGFIKDNFM